MRFGAGTFSDPLKSKRTFAIEPETIYNEGQEGPFRKNTPERSEELITQIVELLDGIMMHDATVILESAKNRMLNACWHFVPDVKLDYPQLQD